MDLTFFPLTLEAIDEAAAESLCLFIASDERPLTGLAGLADWRLSGRLSRLLRSGLLTGDAGEAVLTPPGARLGFQKLFLFGMGRSDQGDEQLVARVAESLHKLAQAGVHEAALQLPLRMSIDTGVRVLVDELQGPGRAMLFGPDPQKLVAALSQMASRSQPPQPERRVIMVPTPAQVRPVSPAVKVPALPRASAIPLPPPRVPPPPQLATPTEIPKASPLPSAPSAGPPPEESAVPAAAVLPAGPSVAPAVALPAPPPAAELLPAGPSPAAALPDHPRDDATMDPPSPPVVPEASATPVAAALPAPGPGSPPTSDKPAEERKPAPPPSQRYVPPVPKPHVFDSKRRKKP